MIKFFIRVSKLFDLIIVTNNKTDDVAIIRTEGDPFKTDEKIERYKKKVIKSSGQDV